MVAGWWRDGGVLACSRFLERFLFHTARWAGQEAGAALRFCSEGPLIVCARVRVCTSLEPREVVAPPGPAASFPLPHGLFPPGARGDGSKVHPVQGGPAASLRTTPDLGTAEAQVIRDSWLLES